MPEREMLEMAARAVGYIDDATNDDNSYGLHRSEHGAFYVTDANGWTEWTPREDDAQAFRLAVALRFEVDIHHTGVAVRTPIGGKVLIDATDEPDPLAATRLAIVKAAASIGEKMK